MYGSPGWQEHLATAQQRLASEATITSATSLGRLEG